MISNGFIRCKSGRWVNLKWVTDFWVDDGAILLDYENGNPTCGITYLRFENDDDAQRHLDYMMRNNGEY